jgi:hypothetical protein
MSCKNEPKKIILPKLPVVQLDSVSVGYLTNPEQLKRKTYVAFIGGKSPYSYLFQIEPAIADCIKKNMDFLIYVESRSEDELRNALTDLNFQYPVLYDEKKLFREANKETIEGYNGYIVNAKTEYLSTPLIHYRR